MVGTLGAETSFMDVLNHRHFALWLYNCVWLCFLRLNKGEKNANDLNFHDQIINVRGNDFEVGLRLNQNENLT